MLRYRCAGIVVVGPKLNVGDLEPLAREVAVVEVGRDVTGGLLDVIRNDDASGTRQAVDHLIKLGHRDIAYIDGGDNPGADLRRDGYRAAITDYDLPTAVIAANDPCAIGTAMHRICIIVLPSGHAHDCDPGRRRRQGA